MWGWLLFLAAVAVSGAKGGGAGAARLVCYADSARADGFNECTHLVYTGDARADKLDALLKAYRKNNPRLKIILRVAETDKDLRSLFKSKHVQGLEIYNAHSTLNRTKVQETVEAARKAIHSSGGGPLFLALPAHPELLAKYYDLMSLVKQVDLMMVQTHDLGVVKRMTYHPSRLSGLWDMMNTDSVVDLVVGLGVPASKIVISLPATVHKFTLLNETLSTPGSPTTEDYPKKIDQAELCRLLQKGRWTLERDQDLSAPYAFKEKTWMSFEDSSSVDVKGKYARVRGLAGLALHAADHDQDTPCGLSLRTALSKVLNQQSRAPRAVVLRSLEQEILSSGSNVRALDALQVSPYRITQVVDSDGVIHSIREDTRTEFSCSRQGYFVHPRSCARFYRCVKFDQLSPEYTVFEFDCPAGLAFDARYEVCVWPGSLPHSQACPGSPEIAPVPQTRFVCPEHEGYYADPENCRWFFACIDHGKAPLTAYEFRCPFGLGFDADKLKCDWPWLVPACGNIARYEAEAFGYSGAALSGAAGFQGQTADSVNIAAHQSLISGASLDNHVGIQSGFLSQADALDSNFIASQELSNTGFQVSHGSNSQGLAPIGGNPFGLVQPTKYTSGSIILDDYRLPTEEEAARHSEHFGKAHISSSNDYSDNSGQYVHDPSGDYAEPYRHIDSPAEPYIHDDSKYKESAGPYDYDRYSASQKGSNYNSGKYVENNSGAYVDSGSSTGFGATGNSGSYGYSGANYDYTGANGYTGSDYSGYYDNSAYTQDNSGSYKHDNSGQYIAGVYRQEGHIGNQDNTQKNFDFDAYSTGYGKVDGVQYLSDTKAYTGASHTLTAGAINVGLVGKTSLVDNGYSDQFNYEANKGSAHSYSHQTQHNAHLPIISEPAVSINHVGTDQNNLDGYSFVTTPTTSGVPTTATPFAVTTAIPTTTYKTTFVPEPPKSSVKEVFGYTQPQVTYIQPTVTAVTVAPKIKVTGYSQNLNVKAESSGYEYQKPSSGYEYPKPNTKFEDEISYTTSAPQISVSTYKPQGFSHSQQTVHNVEVSHSYVPQSVETSGYHYSEPEPVYEEPFKKLVAYTTGAPQTFIQPTAQSFSQQTIHKVETNHAYTPLVEKVYEYKPDVTYEYPKQVEHTTASALPVISYQPQVISHQTLHKVDASKVNVYSEADSGYKYEKPSSGYEYPRPEIKFEEVPEAAIQYTTPAPTVGTKSHSFSQQTFHKYESPTYVSSTPAPQQVYTYNQPAVTIYENPFIKYKSAPVTPATYVQPTAQSYSHQTIHKVESNNGHESPLKTYEYKPTITYEQPKTAVEYTTAQPAVKTYQPQTYSHQTIHKVESAKVDNSYLQPVNTYDYKSDITYEQPQTVIEYSTAKPAVTTYQPQTYSHQTIHKVESAKVDNSYLPPVNTYEYKSGITYEQPQTVVEYTTAKPAVTTYQPQTYSHQTIHKVESAKVDNSYLPPVNTYEYKSGITYEQPQTVVEYTTTKPAVTTYQPQTYSHQTIHKVESAKVDNSYSQPINTYEYKSGITYEQPQTVIEYTTAKPAVTTYQPQTYSHQTIHKVENSKIDTSNEYLQPINTYEYKPETVVEYTKTQPAVVSTYQPQVYSQQTTHEVQSSKLNTYQSSGDVGYTYEKPASGYEYPKPAVQFEETPKTIEYKAPAPVTSTYKPYTYNSQTIHKVGQSNVGSKTYQPAVTIYENPIQKFVENVTPAPIFTQTYKPLAQQHEVSHVVNQPVQQTYSYNQPEIQREAELTSGKAYSDASLVSHQSYNLYHQKNQKDSEKDVVFVSSSPSTLVYEDHYAEYEPRKVKAYKAPEYVPPKVENLPTYTVSSTIAPVKQQSSVVHETQDQYDYNPNGYSQQYDTSIVQQFSTLHVEQPKKTESIHFSSYPEIQVGYKAEEYLPPVVSTVAPVTTTYKPRTYSFSTTKEYLPPTQAPEDTIVYQPAEPEYNAPEYLPPKVTNTYLPPSSTAKPKAKSTTPIPSTTFKAPEYLPPQEPNVISFENYNVFEDISKIQSNPHKEYTYSTTVEPVTRQQKTIFGTKSNLLGFGTVGPDAGLVYPSTTAAPAISSTYDYEPYSYETTRIPLPPRKTRPRYKSTTQASVESTTAYKAPEYLPPTEGNLNQYSFGEKNLENNAYQKQYIEAVPKRKQNIVVETAKSQLLGFASVGSDAGLVSDVSYTNDGSIVSSTETYSSPKLVTSTYAPVKQQLLEVSPVPPRRNKPKVAVVTKINDFNPLLVRKLGAVCSCQSPIVILRGRKPNVQVQQDFDEYGDDDYINADGRGDIDDNEWARKTARLNAVTAPTVSKTTFNPIIVPDDSFYQDFEESVEITPKSNEAVYTEKYVHSTPVSVTERVVKIRPRAKAVTIAPTYKTVVLNQEVAPVVKETESRRDDLQGIKCERAGLFRHPKQCNKFYACRWDCNKQKFTLHTFNCPVQLSFDPSIGACNWPSQGPACQGDTLLTNTL